MTYPDIKTYREDRRQHWFDPDARRRHFMGRTALDTRWQDGPDANLKEDDDSFELEVILPGFSKEEISITLDEEILTIRAEKKKEEYPTTQYIVKEFDMDVTERKFILGKDIEQEKIKAKYDNGILKINFSKDAKKDTRPRKVVEVS